MTDLESLKNAIGELILDIAPDVDLKQLAPDADMRDELDLDSMDFLRLLEAISHKFGVNIPESDYQKVASLQSIADYISNAQLN